MPKGGSLWITLAGFFISNPDHAKKNWPLPAGGAYLVCGRDHSSKKNDPWSMPRRGRAVNFAAGRKVNPCTSAPATCSTATPSLGSSPALCRGTIYPRRAKLPRLDCPSGYMPRMHVASCLCRYGRRCGPPLVDRPWRRRTALRWALLCVISSRRDLTLLTTPPVPIRADLVGPRVVANLCGMMRHGNAKCL